jgi:hypothetical protein
MAMCSIDESIAEKSEIKTMEGFFVPSPSRGGLGVQQGFQATLSPACGTTQACKPVCALQGGMG